MNFIEDCVLREAASACSPAPEENAPRKRNVLIVDDEEMVRLSLSIVLNGLGFAVQSADDGDTALEKIRLRPGHYDIVVTDHNMKRINGVELVKQLRKTGFPGKIMVVTGYMGSRHEEAYHAMGVDRIMYKPWDIVELRKTVRELTE
ncbi:MAG TPA: response regulator [Chthoniobacteraceae bacterium]|nr:response regulator [Chthoniobacteraceae bacterium]